MAKQSLSPAIEVQFFGADELCPTDWASHNQADLLTPVQRHNSVTG